MLRDSLKGIVAFVAVARAGSFTRAAAGLGVSQPALSQSVRAFEERLGVRLLARTTRSVVPTEAGERLLLAVAPRLDDVGAGLAALSESRGRPAGRIRIASTAHAATTLLWPALREILPHHPDVQVEIVVDHGTADVAAGPFDASVRLGGMTEEGVVAVRIGPAVRMAVVGSPTYLTGRRPDGPHDLADHRCIGLRPFAGEATTKWNFRKGGRRIAVRVEGQVAFNRTEMAVDAALDGFGLAYLPEDEVLAHVVRGDLVSVLEEWCEPISGYRLHHSAGPHVTPALAMLLEILRRR